MTARGSWAPGFAPQQRRRSKLAGQSQTSSSFTYDLGVSLDFTLLPVLNIGAHAAYNQWTGGGEPSFQFATVGAHAALVF